MSYTTTVTCPGCGDRFETRTHLLTNALGAPVADSDLARLHGCEAADVMEAHR